MQLTGHESTDACTQRQNLGVEMHSCTSAPTALQSAQHAAEAQLAKSSNQLVCLEHHA